MPFKFNFKFKDAKGGAAITVRIEPQAETSAVTDVLDDGTICIRLAVPPVESVIQEALVEFLCQTLKLKPAQVDIVAGTPLNKLVSLIGIAPAVVDETMRRLAEETASAAEERRSGKKKPARKSRS